MTTHNPITAPVAKLDAAAEGSRELDVEIAEALGWAQEKSGGRTPAMWNPEYDECWLDSAGEHVAVLPYFTTSLDAAMTLVPAKWDVVEADSNAGLWCFTLADRDCGHPQYREAHSWSGDRGRGIFHRKPPALALCIAALRARALPDQPNERTEVRA